VSLRLRLLIALAPLFVVGLAAADAGTYAALQSFLVSRVDDGLRSGVSALLGQSGGGGGEGHGGPPGPALQVEIQVPLRTYEELRGPDGKVLTAQTVVGPTDSTPRLPARLAAGTAQSPRLFTVPGSGHVSRYRAVAVTTASGDVLVLAIPLDDVDATLSWLLRLELVVSGAVTVIIVAATAYIVRRGLRPLERIGATARSIVVTDLSQRVTPATERTEVGRLGLALNTMLGQLEVAFAEREANEQRLRHFLSDASHELRTPLTSMRGYAELLRRNPDMDPEDMTLAMRRIDDETQRMGVLVDDLLLLARLDQGRPLERRPVDLEALVRDARADAAAADPARPVTAQVAAPLVVTGDEMRLRQVLGNLLRNALVHTPAGTPVEVALRPEGDRAVLEVIDHGNGIPAGQAERIFERFHRVAAGRSADQGGSGLGLSIVAAVVQAHGGGIRVLDTRGGGATFRIELALADGPSRLAALSPQTPRVA
jgi:two-component system OmpR family sensor kinase